jgi:hypothetical protein
MIEMVEPTVKTDNVRFHAANTRKMLWCGAMVYKCTSQCAERESCTSSQRTPIQQSKHKDGVLHSHLHAIYMSVFLDGLSIHYKTPSTSYVSSAGPPTIHDSPWASLPAVWLQLPSAVGPSAQDKLWETRVFLRMRCDHWIKQHLWGFRGFRLIF